MTRKSSFSETRASPKGRTAGKKGCPVHKGDLHQMGPRSIGNYVPAIDCDSSNPPLPPLHQGRRDGGLIRRRSAHINYLSMLHAAVVKAQPSRQYYNTNNHSGSLRFLNLKILFHLSIFDIPITSNMKHLLTFTCCLFSLLGTGFAAPIVSGQSLSPVHISLGTGFFEILEEE